MAHHILRTHYDAPIEHAWEVGTDVARMPQWNVTVAEVRDVSGPMDQLGATATVIVKGPDRLHEFRIEVVAAERPHLWSIVGREVGGGMEFTSTSRYTSTDDGSEGEWEQEVKPAAGFVGAFTDRLFMQRVIERQMRQSKENFKELVRTKTGQPV